jgi:hypothetical protein
MQNSQNYHPVVSDLFLSGMKEVKKVSVFIQKFIKMTSDINHTTVEYCSILLMNLLQYEGVKPWILF